MPEKGVQQPEHVGRMRPNCRLVVWLTALTLAPLSFAARADSTSYFIYDESGHVIGEYDQNGNPVQEHIYLGDRPVAVVQGGSSSGGTVDYVTADQLYTPRVITDGGQAVIWTWNSDPFGATAPSGSLNYNLRFMGQYFDAETGHVYNYHRDYDPGTDRYLESDPIGLNGGLATYLYVDANPFFNVDQTGLCPANVDTPDLSLQPELASPGYKGQNCMWKRSGSRLHGSLVGSTPCQCHKQTCTYQLFQETHVDTTFLPCKSHDFTNKGWIPGDMTPKSLGQVTYSAPCN
jgi:RHS repeat-associated protein